MAARKKPGSKPARRTSTSGTKKEKATRSTTTPRLTDDSPLLEAVREYTNAKDQAKVAATEQTHAAQRVRDAKAALMAALRERAEEGEVPQAVINGRKYTVEEKRGTSVNDPGKLKEILVDLGLTFALGAPKVGDLVKHLREAAEEETMPADDIDRIMDCIDFRTYEDLSDRKG